MFILFCLEIVVLPSVKRKHRLKSHENYRREKLRTRESYKRFTLVALVAMLLVALAPAITIVPDVEAKTSSNPAKGLALPSDVSVGTTAPIGESLKGAKGSVTVVIQLKGSPVALGVTKSSVTSSQDKLVATLAAKYGVKVIARLHAALNAVIVKVDASKIEAIAKELDVKSIRQPGTYSLDLADTVPYIGGTEAHDLGYTGAGLRVAVLDSGADFTHAALGGPGTVDFYNTCYAGNATLPVGDCANYFGPTAPKVIGGYDFVGENWPNTAEEPDPNPIDFEGHGTHVSDIIAGHLGVAPDAKIVAIRVCSAVATSCSGIAILQAIDYALDPNGDGSFRDKVDVMNLSLGSNYGQQESDDSDALNNAVIAGIVVVASAGNGSDKPYVVGSPSIGDGVISVAQTNVPTAKLFPIKIDAPASIAGLIKYSLFQDWSAPLTAPITGDTMFVGTACTVGSIPAGVTGKIALINRGTCAASIKVSNAKAAGAIAAIIGLVAPGDPFVFSYGGGDPSIPAFVISQASANRIKSGLTPPGVGGTGVTLTLDPANAISLKGTMVASSSRGPFISKNTIKPEIGAPGASISAQVGTGTGTTAFGGTSGAAPMVSGSALLVRQKFPTATAYEVKALLMNTAYTGIKTLNSNGDLYPTPITSIGAGEVRVNQAVKSNTLAGVPSENTGALSFGYHNVAATIKTLTKSVGVVNNNSTSKTYAITPAFRDPALGATGAVTVTAPASITVPANGRASFTVTLKIDGSKLPVWNLAAGIDGNNGTRLNGFEFDGYLTLTAGTNNLVTLPWHVFPHRSANTALTQATITGSSANITFKNPGGAVAGNTDTFQLLSYKRSPTNPLPNPGDNYTVVNLKAFGVRDFVGDDVLQFGISTFDRRATPQAPTEFDVYVDTNNDGAADFIVFNADLAGNNTDGRNVVKIYTVATGTIAAYYFTDADFNSANSILTVPLSVLGLSAGQKIGLRLLGCDNYYTGSCTDALPSSGYLNYTVGSPRFIATDSFSVPANGTVTIAATEVAGGAALSDARGLLFLYRDARYAYESDLAALYPLP